VVGGRILNALVLRRKREPAVAVWGLVSAGCATERAVRLAPGALNQQWTENRRISDTSSNRQSAIDNVIKDQ
jgi:hypothetical protein